MSRYVTRSSTCPLIFLYRRELISPTLHENALSVCCLLFVFLRSPACTHTNTYTHNRLTSTVERSYKNSLSLCMTPDTLLSPFLSALCCISTSGRAWVLASPHTCPGVCVGMRTCTCVNVWTRWEAGTHPCTYPGACASAQSWIPTFTRTYPALMLW